VIKGNPHRIQYTFLYITFLRRNEKHNIPHCRTVLKSNRNITETEAKSIPRLHIHDRPLLSIPDYIYMTAHYYLSLTTYTWPPTTIYPRLHIHDRTPHIHDAHYIYMTAHYIYMTDHYIYMTDHCICMTAHYYMKKQSIMPRLHIHDRPLLSMKKQSIEYLFSGSINILTFRINED
jgi:hypothetical protein